MNKNKNDKTQYTEFIIDETAYRTKLNKTFTERSKWEKDNPKKILAFIPGTIREVFIKPGDKVKEDDILLILEAMKMRNRITAPLSGKIKAVHIKTNDIVPKNFLLLEFE